MISIESLLRSIGPEIESQVKRDIRGPTSLIFQSFFPQVWAFKTEQETVTLIVDINGDVVVFPGCDEDCDVMIEWKHDYLASLLAARSRDGIPGVSMPSVNADTVRGREAYQYLKGRLGLSSPN